ncbi:hypothetical protein [Bradyrhizobium sp.]|uniref:hypothetical protein n=1 Tax=Bradyrhizobium sp. TaxID=376 RepID=UPI003C298226
MIDAISALIDGVRFDSGSMAVAASKTDFINSISSGSNSAPFGSTSLTSKKPPPCLSHHFLRKQFPDDYELNFRQLSRDRRSKPEAIGTVPLCVSGRRRETAVLVFSTKHSDYYALNQSINFDTYMTNQHRVALTNVPSRRSPIGS